MLTGSARTALEVLRNKMFVTKACRYNADKRLRLEYKLANISLALMSAYLIAISVAPNYQVSLLPPGANYEFWSLVLSVALLGVSSLQVGSDKTQQAYFLHQNAMKIDRLAGSISGYDEQNITPEILASAYDEYSTIVQGCDFNHCKVDELWFKVWNSWLGWQQRVAALILWLVFALYHYGLYFIAIVGPLLVPIYVYFGLSPVQ